MKFREVVGHSETKELLISTIDDERVSHAQLFVGAQGVGALPLAIAYAQRLLCSSAEVGGDSCGECRNCYQMERLENPDCHFVYPVNRSKKAISTGRSGDRPISDHFLHLWRELIIQTAGYISEERWYQELGIENQQGNINREEANELQRKMSFKSVQGGYKVAIIWLPERMHEAAINTLLKLIEEPAPKTLFLFVSEHPDQILATIRSRTQSLVLPPLSNEEIQQELTHRGLGEEAEKIAQAAGGSLTRAISMSERESEDENFQRFQELMRMGYLMKYSELFEWADGLAEIGRERQKQFCAESLSVLRDCYLTGIDMEQVTHADPKNGIFIKNFAPYVNHLTIEPFISEFELLLKHIQQNGNPRIIFPDFALKVSKILGRVKK